MRSLLLALLLLGAATAPSHAHRLKLFATMEGDTVTGYAYFADGDRPKAAQVFINDAEGKEVFRGDTDDRGNFSWQAPRPGVWTVSIDGQEGHMTSLTVANTEETPLEQMVERAVARQVQPLREAIEAAEGRVRFNDVMGGIGMIVGLAGIALWFSARSKRK